MANDIMIMAFSSPLGWLYQACNSDGCKANVNIIEFVYSVAERFKDVQKIYTHFSHVQLFCGMVSLSIILECEDYSVFLQYNSSCLDFLELPCTEKKSINKNTHTLLA